MYCMRQAAGALLSLSFTTFSFYLGYTYYWFDVMLQGPASRPHVNRALSGHLRAALEQEWMEINDMRGPLTQFSAAREREWNDIYNMSDVNCAKVFNGDPSEQDKAINYRLPNSAAEVVSNFRNSSDDCVAFLRHRGYIMSAVNQEEEEFPIAFSIMVYTAFDIGERLLRAIYRPQNVYCIHVDRKANESFHIAWGNLARCFPNVFLTNVSYDVRYNRITVLQADIQCMRELLAYKKWRYFINLTGLEFPLKTNWELVQILKAYNGTNDIDSFHQWSFDGSRDSRFQRHLPSPHNIKPVVGYVHIIASRAYVDFVVNSVIAQDFFSWMTTTFIPDELFFSSLHHLNSHLRVPGSFIGNESDVISKPSMSRYKIWRKSPLGWQVCPGEHWRRWICNLSIKMLPQLAETPKLFLNKVDPSFQPAALHCLEQHLNIRVRRDYLTAHRIDTAFYANLSFVKSHI